MSEAFRPRDPAASRLFFSPSSSVAAEVLRSLAGEEIERLEECLPFALAGRPGSIRVYVDQMSSLARLFERIVERDVTGEGRVEPPSDALRDPGWDDRDDDSPPMRIAGRRRGGQAYLSGYLKLGIVDAPFSPWVRTHGYGLGAAISLLDRWRAALPGYDPLTPLLGTRLPHPGLDRESFRRFRYLVEAELWPPDDASAMLARVVDLFGLNLTELGRLFGSSRQAATNWLRDGLPPARLPKAQAVLDLGELLTRQLKPGRLPAVVRRPADAYGGKTMLEVIAEDGHEELLRQTRQTFDWAATA